METMDDQSATILAYQLSLVNPFTDPHVRVPEIFRQEAMKLCPLDYSRKTFLQDHLIPKTHTQNVSLVPPHFTAANLNSNSRNNAQFWSSQSWSGSESVNTQYFSVPHSPETEENPKVSPSLTGYCLKQQLRVPETFENSEDNQSLYDSWEESDHITLCNRSTACHEDSDVAIDLPLERSQNERTPSPTREISGGKANEA